MVRPRVKTSRPVTAPSQSSVLPEGKAREFIRLCRLGKLYDVEAWINAGTSLTVPADFKISPLEVAVETGFHSLVFLLARNEGQQQVKNKALQKATELRRLELIEILVDEGARVPEIPFLYALRTRDVLRVRPRRDNRVAEDHQGNRLWSAGHIAVVPLHAAYESAPCG